MSAEQNQAKRRMKVVLFGAEQFASLAWDVLTHDISIHVERYCLLITHQLPRQHLRRQFQNRLIRHRALARHDPQIRQSSVPPPASPDM